MRLLSLLSLIFVLLLTLSSCLSPKSSIVIEDAWIREAPPNATAMAGYMRIVNSSDDNIILHSANSATFSSIEFHRSVNKDGVYRMIPQLHLHIPSNSTFELKPGDYHLMLFNPKQQLKQGDEVSISLTFSEQQVIETVVPVKKAQY